jgi:hypothetical protein
MEKIFEELEYKPDEVFEGITNDLNEEENASSVYDPIYLTQETPELTDVVNIDLKKPTITEQLQK